MQYMTYILDDLEARTDEELMGKVACIPFSVQCCMSNISTQSSVCIV